MDGSQVWFKCPNYSPELWCPALSFVALALWLSCESWRSTTEPFTEARIRAPSHVSIQQPGGKLTVGTETLWPALTLPPDIPSPHITQFWLLGIAKPELTVPDNKVLTENSYLIHNVSLGLMNKICLILSSKSIVFFLYYICTCRKEQNLWLVLAYSYWMLHMYWSFEFSSIETPRQICICKGWQDTWREEQWNTRSP